jgi:hypothetical protein
VSEAIHDEAFGRLTWDPRRGCWVGEVDLSPMTHIEVAIWHPGTDVAAGLRTARDGLTWLQEHEDHARLRVAGALIDEYNEDWSDAYEPMEEGDFARRIELVRAEFGDDGTLVLTYDDRGLFEGHPIEAEFAPDWSFRRAWPVA